MKRKIRIFQVQDFVSGGLAYESLVADVLGKSEYLVTKKVIKNFLLIKKGLRLQQILCSVFFNLTTKYIDIRSVIPTASLAIFSRKGSRNVSVFHHYDPEGHPGQFITKTIHEFFIKALKNKVNNTVVVSKYWQDYLIRKGVKNTRIIYNAFDVDFFNRISLSDCEEMRKKFGLTNKKIIYIGNNQEVKGVYVVFDKLKQLSEEYCLIATGNSKGNEPFKVLNLEYKDYLALLKTSECVVTFSLFKEGWCRTAHEAMLLKTPVVGSGLGGMFELLNSGGQLISDNPEILFDKVQEAIRNRSVLGEKGFEYVRHLDKNYFKEEWSKLVKELDDAG